MMESILKKKKKSVKNSNYQLNKFLSVSAWSSLLYFDIAAESTA